MKDSSSHPSFSLPGRAFATLFIALPLFAAACIGSVGDGNPAGSAGAGGEGAMSQGGNGQGTSSSATGGGNGTGGTMMSSSSAASSSAGGVSPAEMVCGRWKNDRANMSEGAWSGDVATCNAGDISADARQNALRLVNLYRSLASLPAVGDDAVRNQKAQSCALMMDANGTLNHTPPMNWACYSADGAQAAGNSNISSGPGVMSIDMYMADDGNDTTLGHRRWILSNSLGPIGAGSTSQMSCLWVIGGNGSAGKAFTPWPPAGLVPIQAFSASFVPLDKTGWSIQSDSINLANAQVTVTDGGTSRPMTVTTLLGGYGSSQAIRMVPNGWTTQAGHTYTVTVTGASQPISYNVEVIDCP